MGGNKIKEDLINELFSYAREIMHARHIFPYVSFTVKDYVVVARGYNRERETFDLTNQDQVVSIRAAQKALDTGDLSGYSLYSFFEPTISGFDVALWSGITDFHWCINAHSYLPSYNAIKYCIADYAKNHPTKITIDPGMRELEALDIVKISEKNEYQI